MRKKIIRTASKMKVNIFEYCPLNGTLLTGTTVSSAVGCPFEILPSILKSSYVS